ncbi:ubiquitin carboxyl-terminal hydrolase 18-like isoform X2 [Lotus japonicus]|uniref:ubiquitin carboxyl-terminal hydrolase 18-like isoform X2 n=1 Tax=Lotus japonicus TaxID=34305 RepID=UPI00258AA68A|nr:ubiquitin carboxyl-terminal hydrolase 18-like isoform X2 [Lotus japonicus]
MLVVASVSWDLNWFLQLILYALVICVGLHVLVKNTASKYFEGEHHSPSASMPGVLAADNAVCTVCSAHATRRCSRCKAVRYCSTECQQSHWKSGHNVKCKYSQEATGALNSAQNGVTNRGGFKASRGKRSGIALVPGFGTSSSRPIKQPKDALFPYKEFVKFFNWDKPGFPPCGLLNCGNSCFANVVLQCLSFTRPLIAYLLEKGHRRECSCNDWCFLCEFESHVERTRQSSQAFSPMNILSRLPNIGGTLGYGRQEDAHEFMRFSIDTMQSVCLEEFGGEKAVPPKLQETTLIQHIFGGHLQSEVICTKCDKISNQYENMMDLTVEIHGDAASLEECLDQFTVKEWLDGDNKYKCDGCKGYVKAWKRLTVKCAPNILTIALKRFQSGKFGKLNKRVAFPETLNLSPYMSDAGDGSDIYKLYAVVVHIDMLNASFFGHYICYIKDFMGNWYRIDDSKVRSVDLEEVLSQGAYMLLYSRCSARRSSLQIQTNESSGIAEMHTMDMKPCKIDQAECLSSKTLTCSQGCAFVASDTSSELKVSSDCEFESSTGLNSEGESQPSEVIDTNTINIKSADTANEISCSAVESSYMPIFQIVQDLGDVDMGRSLEETSGGTQEEDDAAMARSLTATDNAYNGTGHVSENKSAIPLEESGTLISSFGSFLTESDKGNGINKVEISADK